MKLHQLITNGNMASNITSPVTIIEDYNRVSMTCVWTGTPTGTLTLQVSNDYSIHADGTTSNTGTWTSLSPTLTPAGSGGNGLFDIQTGAYAIRLVYTASGGTGSLNVTINIKNN